MDSRALTPLFCLSLLPRLAFNSIVWIPSLPVAENGGLRAPLSIPLYGFGVTAYPRPLPPCHHDFQFHCMDSPKTQEKTHHKNHNIFQFHCMDSPSGFFPRGPPLGGRGAPGRGHSCDHGLPPRACLRTGRKPPGLRPAGGRGAQLWSRGPACRAGAGGFQFH